MMQTQSLELRSMDGELVDFDQQIDANTSVYVCLYNENHEFLIAKKNTNAYFFEQKDSEKVLQKRKRIDNNPGQLVFPGGHLGSRSTVLGVAENEFKAEIGMSLGYFGKPESAVKYTDKTGKDYYAIYVKSLILTQRVVSTITENLRKNDSIRRRLKTGNEDAEMKLLVIDRATRCYMRP